MSVRQRGTPRGGQSLASGSRCVEWREAGLLPASEPGGLCKCFNGVKSSLGGFCFILSVLMYCGHFLWVQVQPTFDGWEMGVYVAVAPRTCGSPESASHRHHTVVHACTSLCVPPRGASPPTEPLARRARPCVPRTSVSLGFALAVLRRPSACLWGPEPLPSRPWWWCAWGPSSLDTPAPPVLRCPPALIFPPRAALGAAARGPTQCPPRCRGRRPPCVRGCGLACPGGWADL